MNPIAKMTMIGALGLLATCGRTEPGRVEGGAATGGPVGVAGAAAPTRDVNLGEPVWDKK